MTQRNDTIDVYAHRLQVGGRAHRIIATVLADNPDSPGAVPGLSLAAAAQRVFSINPVGYRGRDALLDAATAAGVYLHRFRLPMPWEFRRSERASIRGRFDVVYEHRVHGVVIDEVKLGVGRAGELAVRSQIDRQLAEAARLWPRFVGVRLCAVHEPGASRLYLPGRRRSVLVSESVLADELTPR